MVSPRLPGVHPARGALGSVGPVRPSSHPEEPAVTVRAVLLDVNETLFSLSAVRERFERTGLGADHLPGWFAAVLRDGFAVAAADGFALFPDIARFHLERLARAEGHDDPAAAADEVIGGFEHVEAHDDTVAGLRALKDAGHVVATFTNGTVPVTRDFLERVGATDLVDHLLDVTGPELWKPHAAAYRWACDAIGVRTREAAMVAVHPWDIQGAERAGMTGCWLDRSGDGTWPPFLPSPSVTVHRLDEVAGALA